jgi:hypothetical protein
MTANFHMANSPTANFSTPRFATTTAGKSDLVGTFLIPAEQIRRLRRCAARCARLGAGNDRWERTRQARTIRTFFACVQDLRQIAGADLAARQVRLVFGVESLATFTQRVLDGPFGAAAAVIAGATAADRRLLHGGCDRECWRCSVHDTGAYPAIIRYTRLAPGAQEIAAVLGESWAGSFDQLLAAATILAADHRRR